MKKILPFVLFWIADAVMLFLAGTLFASYFTLGNWRFSTVLAAVVSGLIWTALIYVAGPIAEKFNFKMKSAVQTIVFYWVVNFAALWITARLAGYLGFGTPRFVWLLILAIVADFVQYGVWMASKMKK